MNFTLSPGITTVFMFMDGGFTVSLGAVNLFFDGNTSTPGISVFAASTNNSATVPLFSSGHSNACTVGGTSVVPAACVPGSGKLTYDDGANTIALSNFQWDNPGADALDRVRIASPVPNGVNDNIAELTLTITADLIVVPEPTSLLLMGIGLAGIVFALRPCKGTS